MTPRPTILALALTAPVAVFAAPAAGDEITLLPTADATIYEDTFGNSGNGSGEYLHTGQDASGAVKRSLLRFDIAGALPAGATIDAVSLRMFCSRTTSGAVSVGLYRALDDWGEGDSNPPGNEDAPAPASPDDVTWVFRFFEPPASNADTPAARTRNSRRVFCW